MESFSKQYCSDNLTVVIGHRKQKEKKCYVNEANYCLLDDIISNNVLICPSTLNFYSIQFLGVVSYYSYAQWAYGCLPSVIAFYFTGDSTD